MKLFNQLLSFKTLIFYVISLFLISCSKNSNEPKIDDLITVEEGVQLPKIELIDDNNVYGHIVDENYKPIAGVVVSDGFNVVKTNEKGEYQFKKNDKAKFVFYTTPANYAVHTYESRNVASFYKKLASNTNPTKFDFILNTLPSAESKFLLYAIGDPQVASEAEVNRFKEESMADMKEQIALSTFPVYGLSMGDVVADKPNLFNSMKSAMGSTSMTVFTTIGNHDKVGGSASIGRTSESFESHFGPLNYSFDRGNVHFVCMDNVVFSNKDDYSMSFSAEQIGWLEKDLAFVSKDKLLILYYHMPIRNTSFATRTKLFDLIKDFKEVHFMAGHTHYNENFIHSVNGKQIYEHIHAATCGAWWKSTINGDGTPNGYGIYEVEGNSIKSWIYKPTKLSSDFQLRLHWGNASYGGQYGNFTYGKSSSTLIANVWNADPSWKIEVFMDGKKLGDMALNTSLNKDAWSLGYHLGVLNRNPDNYTTTTKHLYTYDVTNPNSSLEVLATDRFGRVYKQNKIVTDLEAAIGY